MTHTLPDVTDVQPIGIADAACLDEIRAVLSRHAAIDRFGITLLHDHFAVADDEMLMETCDYSTRTLTITPQRATNDAGRVIETSWRFSDQGEVLAGLVCKVGCFVDLKDRHKRTHDRVNDIS